MLFQAWGVVDLLDHQCLLSVQETPPQTPKEIKKSTWERYSEVCGLDFLFWGRKSSITHGTWGQGAQTWH